MFPYGEREVPQVSARKFSLARTPTRLGGFGYSLQGGAVGGGCSGWG